MPESGRIRTGTIPPLPLKVCLELVEFPLELTAPESVALRILVTSYPAFGHFHPVGCTNWISRCGFVLVKQPAEEVAPLDLQNSKHRWSRRRRSDVGVRRSQFERSVGAVLVVVTDVDMQDALELSAAEDQEPVEALPAHAADPALRVGVRVRRLERRTDYGDGLALEDAVEGAAELLVPVVDQEERAMLAVLELHQQVAPAASSKPCPGCSCKRRARAGVCRSR